VTGVVQPPINIVIEIELQIALMPLMMVEFTLGRYLKSHIDPFINKTTKSCLRVEELTAITVMQSLKQVFQFNLMFD
jgi:hypothetical protein